MVNKSHWEELLNGKIETSKKSKKLKTLPAVTTSNLENHDVNNMKKNVVTEWVEKTKTSLNPPILITENGFMSIEDAKKSANLMKELHDKRIPEENEDIESRIDVEALQRHLKNIEYKISNRDKRVAWIEKLNITVDLPNEIGNVDVADDLKKENVFHDLTMKGITEALNRLSEMHIPFTRPCDYFADMLKSDHQMYKVRTKLADEQARINTVEARKKLRLEKKFAKKVRADNLKNKQQVKNKSLKKIEEWKKSKFKTPL